MTTQATLLAIAFLGGLYAGGLCLKAAERWIVGRAATRHRLDVLRISRRIGRV